MPPDKTTFHRRNMAGQDDGIAEPTRPAKRLKIGNSMAQTNLSKTIVIYNPYMSSNSLSDQIKISIFAQELSILLNGTDLRLKLPANPQPDEPERLIRIIFHHPLLSSTQHEFYFGPTCGAAKASEIQSSEKWTKILPEKLPTDEEFPSENGCLNFLNNVRTTLEERNFLRSMLGTARLQENNEKLGVENDQDHNSGSSQSGSEYNPFILGSRDPDEGNFLAF